MTALKSFQSVVVAIMVLGVLAGATLLALTSFRDSMTAGSAEYNTTQNWITSSENLSAKAPTAGTLFGVGLIIVAVFGGIFYFMGGSKGF